MPSWRRDVASGLIVVVPILVTLYVIVWLYGLLANVPFLSLEAYPEEVRGPLRVSLILVLFSTVVLGVGYLMRTTVGALVERKIDDAANRLPIVRIVYNASKMAVETALTGTEDLQTPVKIEPWDGVRMTAFKTGKVTEDGREVLFMPTAPNITTGFVIEVDPGDYVESDERVEDALTRILSAGFGETSEHATPFEIDDEGREERETTGEEGIGAAE